MISVSLIWLELQCLEGAAAALGWRLQPALRKKLVRILQSCSKKSGSGAHKPIIARELVWCRTWQTSPTTNWKLITFPFQLHTADLPVFSIRNAQSCKNMKTLTFLPAWRPWQWHSARWGDLGQLVMPDVWSEDWSVVILLRTTTI